MFNFRCDKKRKFEKAMGYAEAVLKTGGDIGNNHPLLDVVRLLGRTVQTQYLSHMLFSKEKRSDLPDITFDYLFFDRGKKLSIDGKMLYDIIERLENNDREVILSKDLILPWPWDQDRAVSAIVNIGQDRKNGEWKQDPNHRIVLWLPIGIALVRGGNHSIAAGIIQGAGTIKPDEVSDISKIYDYVYCDGQNYIRKEDKQIISPVQHVEFAVIFEIGRLMVKHSISF